MSTEIKYRHLPVRPNLEHLRNQAKQLLKSFRSGDSEAILDFEQFHPKQLPPSEARLSDAQLVLARSYHSPSWPRLVHACKLIDAIWKDDIESVRAIVTKHPNLIREPARVQKDNWGPPMSYAANLGRKEIVSMLRELGANDLEHALDRATLQSQIETARLLHKMAGSPKPPENCFDGPTYTLSASGVELMLEFGATVRNKSGQPTAPISVVLETDSRKPAAKHRILEVFVEHGFELPDTPAMAIHRGRIDLLERHIQRDPEILRRTFSIEELFPPTLGCGEELKITVGTPLSGASLLHMCIDFDEFEIAEWLIKQGMNVDIKSRIDDDGFGGFTPLFSTVVSQPNFWMNLHRETHDPRFTKLLLDNGADPNVRASIRKQLHPAYAPDRDISMHEFHNVTALSWGRRFQEQIFVSEPAMRLIVEHGGIE